LDIEVNRRPRFLFPRAHEKKRLKELNQELQDFWKANLSNDFHKSASIDSVTEKQAKVLYSFIESKFQMKPQTKQSVSAQKPKSHLNQKLRKKKKELKKQVKQLKRENKLDEMRSERALLSKVSRRLAVLNKHKRLEQRCRDQTHAQKSFNKDRFKFAKGVFSKNNPSVHPQLSPENTEKYFRDTYQDESRSHQYSSLPGLERKPPPSKVFDSKPPVHHEIRRFLRLESNGSAPGPDGIPYVFYKLFPFAFEMLFLLILRVFKEKQIPRSWG